MDWLPSGPGGSSKNTIQSVTTQETVLRWTGLRGGGGGGGGFSKSDWERERDSKGAQGTDSSASENLTNEMRKWQMPRSRACNGEIDVSFEY